MARVVLHGAMPCYTSASHKPWVLEMSLSEARPINWANFTTISCVAILVGTELVGMSWAAGWALGGLFGLAPAVARERPRVLFGLLGFVALYYFMRAAVKVEPIRG